MISNAATAMATGRASRRWRRARRNQPITMASQAQAALAWDCGDRLQPAPEGSGSGMKFSRGGAAIRWHGPLAVFSSAQQGEPSGVELPARSVVLNARHTVRPSSLEKSSRVADGPSG